MFSQRLWFKFEIEWKFSCFAQQVTHAKFSEYTSVAFFPNLSMNLFEANKLHVEDLYLVCRGHLAPKREYYILQFSIQKFYFWSVKADVRDKNVAKKYTLEETVANQLTAAVSFIVLSPSTLRFQKDSNAIKGDILLHIMITTVTCNHQTSNMTYFFRRYMWNCGNVNVCKGLSELDKKRNSSLAITY